jgi:galactokinase
MHTSTLVIRYLCTLIGMCICCGCRCERYVGTQGGGMDQAVSLLAQAGRAMHVEFNPVSAAQVCCHST